MFSQTLYKPGCLRALWPCIWGVAVLLAATPMSMALKWDSLDCT